MPEVIIAEALSKMFRIGKKRSGNLRDAVSESAVNILSGSKNDPAEFWALKDVSFRVQQGEVLGIIGRNGAGKSTLLKILAHITEPTSGSVEINGRIASLLEVGTGFHPELTGRENIFMNGAILGMRRAEIKYKFDEIVSFSGIEQFIDTPVKRYSSGMYVRLAFAVAAHLEPEILIVDEVLAVGDNEFQKKCLGKMKDVSEHDGRTVLFVSHNMSAIAELCAKALLIEGGQLMMHDYSDRVIGKYIQKVNSFSIPEESRISKQIAFSLIEIINEKGEQSMLFGFAKPVRILMNFQSQIFLQNLTLAIAVRDLTGRKLFSSVHQFDKLSQGSYRMIMKIPPAKLLQGNYTVDVCLMDKEQLYDYQAEKISFIITDQESSLAAFKATDTGPVFLECEWQSIPL